MAYKVLAQCFVQQETVFLIDESGNKLKPYQMSVSVIV